MLPRLYSLVTSFSSWSKELLDTTVDPSQLPTFPSAKKSENKPLPNPLPLAVGQWYQVSIEGMNYDIDENLQVDLFSLCLGYAK